ncbi:hypothetical protein FO519_008148 [Halicephalobus sp. NKZ332]|nr:hypothetical protein FO519_008148 [Halicephalobus sp. NKZ332]
MANEYLKAVGFKHAKRGCVMRGICGGRNETLKQNCAYNTYAVPANIGTATELVDLCPHLFKEGAVAPLCCDFEQLTILKRQMSLAQDLLMRCSSCYANFVNMWCNFACSSSQKAFASVAKKQADERSTIDPKTGQKEEYATDVNFYMNKNYADRIFESCKNVHFAGGHAIDAMCGENHKTCTTEKFFNFLGKADGQNIPFNIHFHLTEKKEIVEDEAVFYPLEMKTYECNEPSDRSPYPCSCSDCESMCSNETPYLSIEERKWSFDDPIKCRKVGAECRMASMECMSGLSVLAGGVLTIVLMGSIVAYYCMSKSTEADMNILALGSGHIPGSMMDSEKLEKKSFKIDEKLIEWSQIYGKYAVDNTNKLFFVSFFIAIFFSAGLFKIRTTTDPVELWSNENSILRKEKLFFDTTFSPFYRIAQIIMYPKDQQFVLIPNATRGGFESHFGPVFKRSFLEEAFLVQNEILNMVVGTEDGKTVTLQDICYKPLDPDNKNCAVMSIFNYFQNDMSNMNITVEDESGFIPQTMDYSWHLQQCISGPFTMQSYLNLSCLGDFGGPVMPYVILGDFNKTDDFFSARGIVITILIENHLRKSDNEEAIAWEKEFVMRLKKKKSDIYSMSYMTERSIEDEIDRASSSDKVTVIISYMFMFIYVAFALGQYRVVDNELGSLFVHSKFSLGIAGVIVVALSVTSSIGIFAFYGIPATMIILEVQPFLILAVGVDNIFLLVQSYQRKSLVDSGLPLKERMAAICGEVIPSMMLSSLSESSCFFLGAITDMPAVKTFSLYAGLAILFNFFFQVTIFLSLFIIDIRRQESGRSEFLCWKRYPKTENPPEESFMFRFFQSVYSPFLLKNGIRFFVFMFFSIWFGLSCLVMPKINLGLDEKMAVPEDSYMLTHFKNMERFMSVGPPVFFVVDGIYNYSDRRLQNLICTGNGCHPDSLGAQITRATRYPQNSYISHPANNWVDDYIDWLRPGPCCRFYKNNGTFCSALEPQDACRSCNVSYVDDRPDPKMFYSHLDQFLNDNPNRKCTKGGKAAYRNALDFHAIKGISGTSFMAYHSPLKNQKDFIRAMDNARYIARNISSMIIVGTIASILVNLIGLMYWWGIDFNAISVVNLVMSVGISVEFCSHIVRAYSLSCKRTRLERAHEALANIGCSVLSGITFTKFGGVIVLAFAHTQIFQVFYFRMFFGIVIIGGMHGLIFLPVLLSIIGPPLNKSRMRELLASESYYHKNTRLVDRRFTNTGTRPISTPMDESGKDLSCRQKLVE